MKFRLTIFFICCLIADSLSQPKFSVSLSVEDTTAYTVYRNEPLVFTTSLVNEELLKNLQWNRAADAWLAEVAANFHNEKLTSEEFEKETELVSKGKKQIKIETIGSYDVPWFNQLQFMIFKEGKREQAWPIDLLGTPSTDSIAILDEDGYFQVSHHLSPEKTAALKPGTYEVQVCAEGICSNLVTVTIRPGKMPASVLNSSAMQLRLGYYYLDQQDADKALYYAETLLQKKSPGINALLLSGESLILKKDYQRALSKFEKALQQHRNEFPDAQEPPAYILSTIAWLKQK